MSPWDAVDEAARRMAAEALERLGWRLYPDMGSPHAWIAAPIGSKRHPNNGWEMAAMVKEGVLIQAGTAAGLVLAVEARVAADREAARAANKGQHW